MLSKVLEIGFAIKHPLFYTAFHIHEQQFMSVVCRFENWTVLKSCWYLQTCLWHNTTHSD